MTTVRRVKRPVAMFFLTVLALIGIGVGAVATTTHPEVYGPSWGRFTAAFSRRVYELRGDTTVSVPGDPRGLTPFSSPVTLNLPVFGYSTSSSPWISYAPLAHGIYIPPGELDIVSVQTAVPASFGSNDLVIQQRLRVIKGVFFSDGVTEVVQDGNGFSVTTVGPQCSNGQCRAAQVISNGRALWELLAVSAGPASTVEGFLASFQPIG